jgi:translation initiation factor 4A
MAGQREGMHLVSEMTDARVSSQVVEDRGTEKAMPEEQLSVTLSDGKGCFACNERSHNLEQCKTKYKLVPAAHQFGYATKFPFTVIQPSNEMVEKKKFFQHCLLIESNLANLDESMLKDELKKLWNLPGDWELRRECSTTFLASFSSEDDLTSCLKNPEIQTLLDNKEVKLTVTRWNESDDGSPGLVEEWLLVSGVPRMYRNWKELYEVASALGVLIDVDEESLQVGDKEPIRLKLKTAFRSFDAAPFSYYFAFGCWSSRLVMVTAVQDKTQGMEHKIKELDCKEHKKELNVAKSIMLEEPNSTEESRSNGKAKVNKISAPAATITDSEVIAAIESSKPEGVQSIAQSPRSMTGEENFRGE